MYQYNYSICIQKYYGAHSPKEKHQNNLSDSSKQPLRLAVLLFSFQTVYNDRYTRL